MREWRCGACEGVLMKQLLARKGHLKIHTHTHFIINLVFTIIIMTLPNATLETVFYSCVTNTTDAT